MGVLYAVNSGHGREGIGIAKRHIGGGGEGAGAWEGKGGDGMQVT
jgi:hypothetical protein